MKTLPIPLGTAVLFSLLLGLGLGIPPPALADEQPAQVEEDASAPDAWPKEFTTGDGASFAVYQPQFTAWDGLQLTGTSAVVVQPYADAPKIYGTVALEVKTNADAARQTVNFEQIDLAQINFPSAKDKAAAWGAEISRQLPQLMPSIALSSLRENLDIVSTSQGSASAQLRNDPPQILFSEKPAQNIAIDGKPQWRNIGDTSLQRAINTRALLIRDGSRYLLHLWDGYVEAPSLNGPWKVAANLPIGLPAIEQKLVSSEQIDLLADNDDDADVASLKTSPLPDIYITTQPTELIISEGALQWTPVSGTQLLTAANTNAYLFKDIASQKSFLLLSGRWFRSGDTMTAWNYVPADQLPADFARIPDNSPQEAVKASVAGTEQAQEAAIANTVPEVVRVERTVGQMDKTPAYDDGQPKLAPVENTSLYYVLNSDTPVIKVNADTWFACENGVWFTSDSAFGPWRVAIQVPTEVYKIPLGSPIHYVTYVRIQRYDSNYVWFCYTPGYYGTIVSTQGTVVYGTGYYYPAYVGTTIYVSYPASYGYCYNPCWTPWRGWYFGFSTGWVWTSWNYYRCRPPPPCWGPYRGHHYRPGYVHSSPRPGSRYVTHPRINFRQPDPRKGTAYPPRQSIAGTRFNRHTGRPIATRSVPYDLKVAEKKSRAEQTANLGRSIRNGTQSSRFAQGTPSRIPGRTQPPVATQQRSTGRPGRTDIAAEGKDFRPLPNPGRSDNRDRPGSASRPNFDRGSDNTVRPTTGRQARPMPDNRTTPSITPPRNQVTPPQKPPAQSNPVQDNRPQRERPTTATPEGNQKPSTVTPERTRPQRPVQPNRDTTAQERRERPAVQEQRNRPPVQERRERPAATPEKRQQQQPSRVAPEKATPPARPVQPPRQAPVERHEAPRPAPVQRSAPSSTPSRGSSSDKDNNPGSGRTSRGK